MAVKFKGISEYKSKFKGRSARSRSASPQFRMPKAGLRSDQLGVSREPQFHSKKRVPFHRPRVYQSFQWPGPEELPREHHTPRPSTTPAAAPPAEAPGDAEGAQTPLAPRGPRPSGALCEGSVPVTQAPPPAAEPRGAVTVEEAEPVLNGVHHVLKRRAGLKSAGRANRLLSSEYQRQFQRKTRVASSPLLAAEQVVYSSSPVIPPFKANPLVQESEYRRSFKGSPPPRAPRLRRDLEQREEGAQFQPEQDSPERAAKNMKKKKKKKQLQLSRKPSLQNGAPQCGSQSQWRETRSQSPPQPRPSHGGYRKVRSEYSSHFRSPLHYRLRDGVWVRSSTAAAEAQELREKAEAYRRRAWGTHFSRDHLNQILSEQNRLWEASTASDTGTERSSTSSTIHALDLASIESVRGSTDRRSLPRSPSARSPSGGGSEEAELHNAPTLPVRRKLVWGEAEPEQKDRDEREKLGEEPHGGKRREELEEEEEQEEEEYKSDKATASGDLSPTSDSHSSVLGGRLPTPKMKTITTIQRTHHDLTTPTTGGAILVSPPKPKEASPGRSIRRSEPPLGKPHSPHKPLSRASPERVGSKGSSSPHSSPAAGLTTADPIPLREDAWPAHPSPDDSPAPRPAGTSRRRSPAAAPPPPAPAPTNRILGKLRDPEFQHNGNLGFVRHEMAAAASADLSDDDDRMSQISAWSAASCSMASQVLERAQKRQKSFWGKS
ncbi:nuclear protein MDM1 isoform X2 [Anguilla rostrata]|uniref:nuclear protein MDM1 isoform X2 n=1 Tax=Anguilla rostrata TaxID=7938 RepID=UPI0030CB0149